MKNIKLKIAAIVLFALIIIGGGYVGLRSVSQTKLIKTANTSHSADARYVSFGANYVFAIPSSFTVDETSIAGVQLLLPAGGASLSVNSYDQLFDATVIAVQPVNQIKPKDSQSLKDYVNQSMLPDLRKNLSSDITVTYKTVGKYLSANIVVKKDGQQVRQMYVYAGTRPFVVTSKEKTDVSTEIITTLVDVNDATAKDDIDLIKKAAGSNMTLLVQGKLQELLDGGTGDFKQKTTLKDLTSAVSSAGALLRRNIVVTGGSLQGNVFVGQIFFTPPTKDDQPSLGSITLNKDSGQWKVSGFSLPTIPAAPAPTPKK